MSGCSRQGRCRRTLPTATAWPSSYRCGQGRLWVAGRRTRGSLGGRQRMINSLPDSRFGACSGGGGWVAFGGSPSEEAQAPDSMQPHPLLSQPASQHLAALALAPQSQDYIPQGKLALVLEISRGGSIDSADQLAQLAKRYVAAGGGCVPCRGDSQGSHALRALQRCTQLPSASRSLGLGAALNQVRRKSILPGRLMPLQETPAGASTHHSLLPAAGADALAVRTDSDYTPEGLKDLWTVCRAVKAPVLALDWYLHPLQVRQGFESCTIRLLQRACLRPAAMSLACAPQRRPAGFGWAEGVGCCQCVRRGAASPAFPAPLLPSSPA